VDQFLKFFQKLICEKILYVHVAKVFTSPVFIGAPCMCEVTCIHDICCVVISGLVISVRSLLFTTFIDTGCLITARFSATYTLTHTAYVTRADDAFLPIFFHR